MDNNIRTYLVELIATFLLVLISAGAVCASQLIQENQPQPGLAGIALAIGVATAVAVAFSFAYDGGFVNPAITLMLWVVQRFDGKKTSALIFVQCLGAALAGGLLRLVLGSNTLTMKFARLGTPHVQFEALGYPGSGFGALMISILLELGLTFVLAVIVFAVLVDRRFTDKLPATPVWLCPIWIGLVAAGLTLAAFNFTGAAMNPARWFGTFVWELTVPTLKETAGIDAVVYLVGPIAGTMVLGFLIYFDLLFGEVSGAKKESHAEGKHKQHAAAS
ncbi:MAG: aquaporin [Gemmatales bacterium]|nr:MAG: aquaporin [Gemmatales bacterium]